MNWDISKYHLISTLLDNQNRENFSCKFSFTYLKDTEICPPKFYYGYKTSDKFLIDRNNIASDIWTSYFQRRTGWVGCLLSFYDMIQYAKLNDWPYIFCFEDDILIKPRATKILNDNLSKDFDGVLLIGYNQSVNNSNFIFPIKNMHITGGYSMLITKNMYDLILSIFDDPNTIYYRDTYYLNDEFRKNVYLLSKPIVKPWLSRFKTTIPKSKRCHFIKV